MKKIAIVLSFMALVGLGSSAVAQNGKHTVGIYWGTTVGSVTEGTNLTAIDNTTTVGSSAAAADLKTLHQPSLQLNYAYRATRVLDLGVFVGLQRIDQVLETPTGTSAIDYFKKAMRISTGLQAKARVLEWGGASVAWLDPYLTASVGTLWAYSRGMLQLSMGGGVAVYPLPFLGINAEVSWGKFPVVRWPSVEAHPFRASVGVSVRF